MFISRRWAGAALIASVTAAPVASQAQPDVEPPRLEAPGPAPGVDTQQEPEIYTRGPLHEAFAQPIVASEGERPVVSKAPPDPIEELPPDERPEGNNVVWIPGYWAWDDALNDYLWVSGLWRELPPGRRWVPGYWHEIEGGYTRVPGLWVSAETESLTYLPEPPATLERGPSSPQPDDNSFWVPGYWVYTTNDYQWRPGRWAPFSEDWVWVPAHYEWTPLGYVFVEGYWDYEIQDRGIVFAPVHFHGVYQRPYTPVTVINTWENFLVNLFVSPRFGWYTFGNYYGRPWQSGAVLPLYSFHGHRHGYDPLFVHYHKLYGNAFSQRMRNWHNYYANHEEARPAATWRQQRELARHTHTDRETPVVALASSFNDVVRNRGANFQFVKVSDNDRTRIIDQSRTLNDFSRNRVRFEREQQRVGGKRGQANSPAVTLELPKAPEIDRARIPRTPRELSRDGGPGRSERNSLEPNRPQDSREPTLPRTPRTDLDDSPRTPERPPATPGDRRGRPVDPTDVRPNTNPSVAPRERDERTREEPRQRRDRLLPDFPGRAPDRGGDRSRPDAGRPEDRGRPESRPEPMPRPRPEDRRTDPPANTIPSPEGPTPRPPARDPNPGRGPGNSTERTPKPEDRRPSPRTSNFGPRPEVPDASRTPDSRPRTPGAEPSRPQPGTPLPDFGNRPDGTPTPRTPREKPNPGIPQSPRNDVRPPSGTPSTPPQGPRVDPRSGPGVPQTPRVTPRPKPEAAPIPRVEPRPQAPAVRPQTPPGNPGNRPMPNPSPPTVAPPAAPPVAPPAGPAPGAGPNNPPGGEKKGKK